MSVLCKFVCCRKVKTQEVTSSQGLNRPRYVSRVSESCNTSVYPPSSPHSPQEKTSRETCDRTRKKMKNAHPFTRSFLSPSLYFLSLECCLTPVLFKLRFSHSFILCLQSWFTSKHRTDCRFISGQNRVVSSWACLHQKAQH